MNRNIAIKIWNWCKKEIVLSISAVLAIVSMCFVTPDKTYLEYIDFRTLAILFCLMAVMAGLQKIGLFRLIAEKLLKRVNHIRGIAFILTVLCFVSSMLITNDVALITFVPFTMIVLRMISAESLVIPIVVMQTISANLGSMLTPIGNPQNLYLYGQSGMGFAEFVLLMLPYTAIALLLLTLWCFVFPYRGEKRMKVHIDAKTSIAESKKQLAAYGVLFFLCLLTVAHIIPASVIFGVVVVAVLLIDQKSLWKVDYSLLLTFVALFIFIGNVGRIPTFNLFLKGIITGNEVITGIASSQIMSNVPAAILLSGFTNRYDLLIVGTNLGGLGTIIASMASLISFKYIGEEYPKRKGRYLLCFTIFNVIFLVALFGLTLIK